MKQKNLITVVAAHQLTADTIAKAIGANHKCDGYYVGNGYAVTWTGGSLIEATFSPDERFVLSTSMGARLMFAHNFSPEISDSTEKRDSGETAAQAERTQNVISTLKNRNSRREVRNSRKLFIKRPLNPKNNYPP